MGHLLPFGGDKNEMSSRIGKMLALILEKIGQLSQANILRGLYPKVSIPFLRIPHFYYQGSDLNKIDLSK